MKRLFQPLFVVLVVVGSGYSSANAGDSRYPQDEYAKHISSAQTVGTLGSDLFGEQVNFFTGATEFHVTDISIPGQGPAVSIGRRFEIKDRGNAPMEGAFADWDLDIPHLHGVFGGAQLSQIDWTVSTTQPAQRCSSPTSDLDAIPPVKTGPQGGVFDAREYWSGNSLYVPGQGDQPIMLVVSDNPYKPATGLNYRWVTAGQWYFSCLPTAAYGSGDAFLAIDPEGTRYWFDRIIKLKATIINKPYGQGPTDLTVTTTTETSADATNPAPQAKDNLWFLKRQEVWILPTRIEDRFGNSVAYTYSTTNPSHLTQIVASDGRHLDLTYTNGVVTSVTDGQRTWTYAYSGALTTATYPDGSKWSYDLISLRMAHIGYLPVDGGGGRPRRCDNPGFISTGDSSGTMTHPSGAVGTFTVAPVRMGRSYVSKTICWALQGDGTWHSRESIYPVVFDNLALTQKKIAGPGQATLTWDYVWGPANFNYVEDCTANQCPSSRTLTVNGPTDWVRYTHSNKFFDGEGKLLLEETGAVGSGTPLITTQYVNLLSPIGQAYPSQIGIDIDPMSDKARERHQPQILRKITQQGRTFTWQVSNTCGGSGVAYCFDQYARPTKVIKSSASPP